MKQLIKALYELYYGLSFANTIVLILCIVWTLWPLFDKPPAVTNAVYHGYSSWLEPTLLLRARFIFQAKAIIASGTLKARHFTARAILF
jgi:hypothetical protein